MVIKKKCPMCGKDVIKDLDISVEELNRYNNGELIQNVLPHLSATDREFLISGFCNACQNVIFAEPKE